MGRRARRYLSVAIAAVVGLLAAATGISLLGSSGPPLGQPTNQLDSPLASVLPGATTGPDLRQTLTQLGGPRFTQGDRAQARQYITAALQTWGWEVQAQPVTGDRQTGVNLIATRPSQAIAGSIVLGAHYDTVAASPGADDNGTGVVALLEAARRLGPSTAPVPLTLVFFDLEEAGLWGSRAFVAAHPDVSEAVILEMLGFRCREPGCQRYPAGLPVQPAQTTGEFLAAIGDRAHRDLVDSFAAAAPLPVVTLAVPTLGPLTPDLLRSDHVPFWKAGIGAVMLTDTANFRNPNYHRPSDRVDTLDLAFFQAAAQLVIERVEQRRWALVPTREAPRSP